MDQELAERIAELREEYRLADKAIEDATSNKKLLEKVLRQTCPHDEVEYGSDRWDKWCICKRCGLYLAR